jgi:hypothetical protein
MDSILEMLCGFGSEMRVRPLNAAQQVAIKLRVLDTLGGGVAASAA